ncbi:KGK domain-containing protein [Microcoleus sp. FACHB-68]|uniref:KGK domain-containing protein n=1 Tax=Microcoleus sp. FACHB-68 TaxID=2692826 RepID=UPI001684DA21|nr:KGK domain-containing protein [Microcoleus sp. FACHB-68]MBD1937275.1 hypothetical protein [Microcoleus sp. FACHB-68]
MPFEQLEGEEHVFSTEESGVVITGNNPAKVHITGSLSKFLSDSLTRQVTGQPAWMAEGVESRLLKVGASSWVKGKIRFKIVFEFCPDEPAGIPELEEFRQ